MVVWLFTSLVITTSYTANLTSMLTVQRLEPTVVDVEYLKRTKSIVGCGGRSFVAAYLVEVIGIEKGNIRNFTSADEYPRALRSGEIAAAFIEAPYAKLFLAQNCKGFIASGKTHKVGGFGFVSIVFLRLTQIFLRPKGASHFLPFPQLSQQSNTKPEVTHLVCYGKEYMYN